MRWKPFVLLLVVGIGIAGMSLGVRRYAMDYGLNDVAAQSRERLKLISATLSTRIERFRYLPDVIARSRETENLFRSGGSSERQAEANRLLARIADASGASALYVTDATGLTIASSNYDQPGSFVGQNYSYRPYFQDAFAQGFGSYYAVGATTGQPGYFLAVPIKLNDRKVGVAIVKIDLLPVEDQWRDASELVAMTDRQGIIFLSSRADWRYTATGPVNASDLARLTRERRYGDVAIAAAGFRVTHSDRHDMAVLNDIHGERRLLASIPFGNERWTLHYFASLTGTSRQADTAAAAAALAGLLAAAGGTIALQRRRAKAAVRKAFEDLESRVAERTSALSLTNERLEQQISERQEAERQLNVTRSNLSQAEKLALIGQTFAGLAHEINQPLAALATYIASTRLLLKRRQYGAIGDNIDTMNEVVGRVSHLTDQLKRLARRGDNDDFVELDLDATVRRMLALLKFRFADLGIEVFQTFEGDMRVYGNPVQLDQVILNLLSNAIDAVRQSPSPQIEIRGFEADGCCIVTVHDNGPGVDDEMSHSLFEPFQTTKPAGEGLGLGLATAHRIIADHHGTLSFGRSPLGGASFTISLGQAEEQSATSGGAA